MKKDVFQAIAEPKRRAILDLLVQQSLTINDIADQFEISRPAVSKHIKILTESELVVIHQNGRERYCEAQPDKLNEVTDWIEQYQQRCEQRFNRLDDLLQELQERENSEEKQAGSGSVD